MRVVEVVVRCLVQSALMSFVSWVSGNTIQAFFFIYKEHGAFRFTFGYYIHVNTLRTGDADLRHCITTVQDG